MVAADKWKNGKKSDEKNRKSSRAMNAQMQNGKKTSYTKIIWR